MSHRLFHPLPPCSSPLNSNLINLAAQSLAFFYLVWHGAAGWTPGRPQISPSVAADVNQLPRTRQSKP